MSQEADILPIPILSAVLALWSDVGCGSGLRRGVWGKGRKRFRTEVQPSDQLLLGKPWVVVVAVAGSTMVQRAGK